MGDDPPYLQVGTEVSAKYKGAFCEAKIRKVVRVVKCKVTFKAGHGSANLSDDHIKGELRVGNVVEAKHQEQNKFIEATINKIQDCSQYTVVFDDGDITTLRRSALCLKSGRHFNESETLDQLPLTHPEHFSNPVVGGRRGVRRRAAKKPDSAICEDITSNDDNDNESSEDEDTSLTKKGQKKTSKEADMGKVVCVESNDKKKSKDNWFPALIVSPSAQETVKIRTKDEYLVRSFRDGRYYTVPKKEITDFTKDSANKSEHSSSFLRTACEKAVQYLEKNVLPPHWDRDILFGHSSTSNSEDVPSDSESDEDYGGEKKDRFVAQLYKYMEERGTPINKVPSCCGKELDIYKLYRVVTGKGGYNKVTNSSQWKPVTMKMGYGTMPTTSTINLVKQTYKKYMHNFEEFYRKLGDQNMDYTPPVTPAGKSRSNRSIFRERERHASSSVGRKEKEEPKLDKKDDEMDKKSTTSAASGTASATPSEVDAETESLIEGESAAEEPRRSRSRLESRGKKEFDEVAEKTDKPSPGVGKSKRVSKKKDAANASTVSASELKEREKEREEAQTPVSASPSPAPSSTGGKRGRGKYKKRDKQQQQEVDEDENRSEPEESHDHIGKNVKIEIGDKLQVYYGPKSKGNVTYEAKVVDIRSSDLKFLVHYTGWNTRYDEWIDRYRIASTSSQKDGAAPPDLDSVSTNSPAGSSKQSMPKAPKKKGRPASIPAGSGGGPPPNSSGGTTKGKTGARKRLLSESEKSKGRRSRKKSGQESLTQSGSESDQDQDAGDSSDSEEKQRLISTPPSSVSSTASSARASNKASGGRRRKVPLTMAAEDDDASSASSSTTVSSTGKSNKPDSSSSVVSSSNREKECTVTPVVTSSAVGAVDATTANSENETNQNQVIDLNKIRSEMKGLDKMVKVSTTNQPPPLPSVTVTTSQQSTSPASSTTTSPAQSSTSVSSSVSAATSPLPHSVTVAAAPPLMTTLATTLHSPKPLHTMEADIKLDVYEFQDDTIDAPNLKMFAPRSPDKKEESSGVKISTVTGTVTTQVESDKSVVKNGDDLTRHHTIGTTTVTPPASTTSCPNVSVTTSSNTNPVITPTTISSPLLVPLKASSPALPVREESVKSKKELKKEASHISVKEVGRKEKEAKEGTKLQPSSALDSPVSVTTTNQMKACKNASVAKPIPSVSAAPVLASSTFDRVSYSHLTKAPTSVGGSKLSAISGVSIVQPAAIIENKSTLKMQTPIVHTQQPPRQRALITSNPPPLIPSGAPKVSPVQIQPRVSTLSPPMPSLTQRPALPSLVASTSPNASNLHPGLPQVTPQLQHHPQIQHDRLRPVAPPTSAIVSISMPSGTSTSTEQSSTSHVTVSTAPAIPLPVPLPPAPILHPASTVAVSASPSVALVPKIVDPKGTAHVTGFANRQQELFPHLVNQQQPQPLLKQNCSPLPKIAPTASTPQHQTPISVITPNQNLSSSINICSGNTGSVNKDSLAKSPNFSQSQGPVGIGVPATVPSLGAIGKPSLSPFTVNPNPSPQSSPRKSPVKRKQSSKDSSKNRPANPDMISREHTTVGISSLNASTNLPPKKKQRKVITKNIIDIYKKEGESVAGQGPGQVLMQGSSSVPSVGRNKDDHSSGADSPTKKARKPAKKRIKIDSEMAIVRATSSGGVNVGGVGFGFGVADKSQSPVKTPKKKQITKIDIPAPPQLLPAKTVGKSHNTLRYLSHTATSSSNTGFGSLNTVSTSVPFTNTTTTNIVTNPGSDNVGCTPGASGTPTPIVVQDTVIKSAVYIKPPELQVAQGKPVSMKGLTTTMGSVSGSVLGVLKTPDKKSYSPKMSAAAAARIASCIETVAKLPPEAQVQTKSVLTIQPAKAAISSTINPTSVAVAGVPAGGNAMTTTTFVKIPGKFEPEPIVITTVTTSPPASQFVATKPVTVIPAMVQKAVSGASTVQTINITSSNSKSATEAAKATPVLTTLPSSLILSPSGGEIGGRNIKPIMVVPISKDSISIPQTNLPVILKTEMKEEISKLGTDLQKAPAAVPLFFVKKNQTPFIAAESNSAVQATHINISNSSITNTNTGASVLSIKVSTGGGEESKVKVLTEDRDVIPVVSIKEAAAVDSVSTNVEDIVKVEGGTASETTKDEDESCHSLLCEEEIPGSPPPGADSSLFGIDDENARLSISSPKESPKLSQTTPSSNSNNPSSSASTAVLSKLQLQMPYSSGNGSASSASTSVMNIGAGTKPVDTVAENKEKKTDEICLSTSSKPSGSSTSSSTGQSSSETLNLLQKHRDVGKAAQSLLSLADRDRPSVNSSGHLYSQNQNQVPIQLQPPIVFPNTHNQNLQNVMDNTPPTTPESSSISSGSPRVEGGRVSPTQDHPSSSKSNSKDSSDVDSTDHKINEVTEEGSSSDAGRKSLKGVSSSPQKKRHVEAIRISRNSSPPSKRRRVQRRKSPDEVIRSYGYRGRGSAGRKSNSDKDHDHGKILPPPPPINLTRPPVSRKFNFIPDLDDAMESEHRIQVLQVALQSIKEKYQEVKSELSSEERRLKRFKRRQKEREKEKSRACLKST